MSALRIIVFKRTLFDNRLSNNKITFKVVSGDTRTLKTQESLKMDVTCDLFRYGLPPYTVVKNCFFFKLLSFLRPNKEVSPWTRH